MFEIRNASPDDAEQIAALTSQLGYPSTKDEILLRLNEMNARKEHSLLVAQSSDGKIVGYIHLEERFLIERNPSLQVAALVVEETCRGSGVGKKLMRYAEDYAQKRGFDVFLSSSIRREDAHRFYEGLGYKRISTSYKFEKSTGMNSSRGQH